MAKLTNAQLVAQLEAAHVAYQKLAADRDSLQARLDAWEVPAQYAAAQANARSLGLIGAKSTGVRPVYEWNPNVVGDFARASKLARENNGTCVRVRTGFSNNH